VFQSQCALIAIFFQFIDLLKIVLSNLQLLQVIVSTIRPLNIPMTGILLIEYHNRNQILVFRIIGWTQSGKIGRKLRDRGANLLQERMQIKKQRFNLPNKRRKKKI
jgi:hypothetical protein